MAETLGLAGLQAAALNNIGTSRANSGDSRGIDELERAIEIASAAKNVHEHGRALINLAVTMVISGELERAYELERASYEVAHGAGERVGLRWAEGNLVKSLYWRGDWDEAIRLAETFIVEAESGVVHYLTAQAYYQRAGMRLARGEAGAVEDVGTGARARRGRARPPGRLPDANRRRVRLLDARSDGTCPRASLEHG